MRKERCYDTNEHNALKATGISYLESIISDLGALVKWNLKGVFLMKSSMIEMLFSDSLENEEIYKHEAYQKYVTETDEIESRLQNQLGSICEAMGIDLYDEIRNISCASEKMGFVTGFKYAMRLCMECKL